MNLKKKDYFKSIVSNRKTQFIAHFWRRLCERIKTNSKLSTIWHVEIDEQTKIVNVDLKAYLKVYVNFNQNNWMNQLFITKFETNSVKNSFITLKSFLTTKRYLFRSNLESSESITKTTFQRKEMRNVDKFIEKLETIKIYLRKKFKWAQARQKNQTNRRKRSAIEFKLENKVMLNFRFLKIMRFNRNLNYKNLKSFTINRIINNSAY